MAYTQRQRGKYRAQFSDPGRQSPARRTRHSALVAHPGEGSETNWAAPEPNVSFWGCPVQRRRLGTQPGGTCAPANGPHCAFDVVERQV